MTEDVGRTFGPQPRRSGMEVGVGCGVVVAVGACGARGLALGRGAAGGGADEEHCRHCRRLRHTKHRPRPHEEAPFRTHQEGGGVDVVHDTCRAVCAVKKGYRNVLSSSLRLGPCPCRCVMQSGPQASHDRFEAEVR